MEYTGDCFETRKLGMAQAASGAASYISSAQVPQARPRTCVAEPAARQKHTQQTSDAVLHDIGHFVVRRKLHLLLN